MGRRLSPGVLRQVRGGELRRLPTYLAPYIPAEYIENIREYDTEALEAALTGGGE